MEELQNINCVVFSVHLVSDECLRNRGDVFHSLPRGDVDPVYRRRFHFGKIRHTTTDIGGGFRDPRVTGLPDRRSREGTIELKDNDLTEECI